MYMLLRYPFGVTVEGVVLAKGNDWMRVAVQGSPDTIELRRSGPVWLTSAGDPVEFDFVMSIGEQKSVSSPESVHNVRAAAWAATISEN